MEQARRQGSQDNITAVVVFLRPVDVLMEEEHARREAGLVSKYNTRREAGLVSKQHTLTAILGITSLWPSNESLRLRLSVSRPYGR